MMHARLRRPTARSRVAVHPPPVACSLMKCQVHNVSRRTERGRPRRPLRQVGAGGVVLDDRMRRSLIAATARMGLGATSKHLANGDSILMPIF